ncbi:pentapeptide repeat-containing protein [Halocatena marina]|nr:pentapeptide repeat-containing protein [Halocatena marina]
MTESATTDDSSLLDLSPAERDEYGITAADVQEELLDVIVHDSAGKTVFVDCTLPRIDLDYQTLDSESKHPVIFRNCTFTDGISAVHADIKFPLRFEECTISDASFDRARFEYDLTATQSTFMGAVTAYEARFERTTDFTETTISGRMNCDEAAFGDEARFTDVTFEGETSFRAASFSGRSNDLDDHASFERAVFTAKADFRQSDFQFARFDDATFHERAQFEAARFDGDVEFATATFHGEADFDEIDFKQDVSFDSAEFRSDAVFRGTEFEGGARTLKDDARFAGVRFDGDVNFRDALFRYVNFDGATFGGHAMFERAWFDGDADFTRVTLEREANFDEARFHGDTDFTEARFERSTVFRGAEFTGETNYLKANVSFERALFAAAADFDNAKFTSANFSHTQFGGVIDFSGAEFADSIDFLAESIDTDTHVDFTRAVIKGGTITQPAANWVGYDLTLASLGDLTLEVVDQAQHPDLLDYFRFCNTEFDEFDGNQFDFTAHTRSLSRNDWKLHTFEVEENAIEYEYALDMTPDVVETTYLKAKNAASSAGYIKAAGEFRVKRQRYARKKHFDIARTSTEDARTRFKNLSRAAENYFLDITCGHGMRLVRIIAVFLIAPFFPALLFAFGGELFRTSAGQLESLRQLTTPEGLAILYDNIHFSYITFLTIGYGGIAPEGTLARLFAGVEVYVSVILGGLVLYALIKRSEL